MICLGALALCVLCTLVGTIMGFILLGGSIYDTRMPGGMSNAVGLTQLRSTQADLKFFEDSQFIMKHSRVLLHIPGREPVDGLNGWPGLADTQNTVLSADPGEQSQLAQYADIAQEYLGIGDDEAVALQTRDDSIINVSTTLSFVRTERIENWKISLTDGIESQNIVPYIVAVANERVNFDTLTESLFCVSQLVVGTGWSTIQARVHLALGYLGDVYIMFSFSFFFSLSLAHTHTYTHTHTHTHTLSCPLSVSLSQFLSLSFSLPLSLSDSLSLFLSLTQVDIIRRAGGFGELVLRTLLRSPVGAYDKDALGGKEEKR